MGKTSIEHEIDKAVNGWVRDGLVLKSGWKGRPLLATPLPSGRGVVFDPAAVERVLQFFQLLEQQIGRWAAQKFTLLDWQVRYLVAPVFGIKHKATGLRAIRTVWFEIPRKNGKSTLCSGLSLYLMLADREPGAQVYAAAGDKSQASIVFKASAQMAAGSRPIREALGKRGIQRALMEHPSTGAIYRVLSSDGARQHGLNIHGAIIDEVHVHKNPDLIEALETGVGSREQPLVVFITTADAGADGSIYATKREYLEAVVAGTATDHTFHGVVFGVDDRAEGFDPFSDETLRAANPGADVTVLMDYLRAAAHKASQSPAELNSYLRLHLNVRTRQETRWFSMDQWVHAGGNAQDPDRWRGRLAWGGLDLSATSDFTAFVLISRDPNVDGYDIWPLLWLPEAKADELERKFRLPLAQWASEGWLRLTEGDWVSYAQASEDIRAAIDRLGVTVRSVGFDSWNAAGFVQPFIEEGVLGEWVPVQQTYAKLNPASKELERLLIGSTPDAPLLRHGQHPVLRWMADCVTVRQSPDGLIKPVKPDRFVSSKRIDGVAALVDALSQAVLDTGEDSAAEFMAAWIAEKASSVKG